MISFVCLVLGTTIGMLVGRWYERRSTHKIKFNKIEFSLPLRRKR